MEVTSMNVEEDVQKLNVDIDETVVKDIPVDHSEQTEKTSTENDSHPVNSNIDYDDEEDSGDDIAVITKTSAGVDSSPAKNMFSIKAINNVQTHNNYKISKTAIDLDHPGNINGVPTVDYDLSKLNDDCKPWKKPGADVSDFFNYGFNEESWLMYCEKQKALRLAQDGSALKTLNGLTNFGYNLSGSHMNMSFNRNNQKSSTKGGLIDVIGCQQSGNMGGKQQQHGDMGGKISTIPVQAAGGHMGLGPGQANNYISGLASQALSNNLLNPLMSALAMGMLPNGTLLGQQQGNGGGPLNGQNYGHGNNWSNGGDYQRHNSADSMHSHEDYGDRRTHVKTERSSKRAGDFEEPKRHRSRDRRDKSTEKRRRSRSRSRDRGHDSKHSRSKRSNRSPERRRSRKRSKDRGSSGGSSKRHRGHKSSKKSRRSRSHDDRKDKDKDRHRRHKSPADPAKNAKEDGDKQREAAPEKMSVDNVKREKEAAHAD